MSNYGNFSNVLLLLWKLMSLRISGKMLKYNYSKNYYLLWNLDRFALLKLINGILLFYSFVHIDADAGKNKVNEILRELNGYNLNGSQIRVQQSTSGVRQKPGMGGDQCYR